MGTEGSAELGVELQPVWVELEVGVGWGLYPALYDNIAALFKCLFALVHVTLENVATMFL